ncbi:MAG: hypothetical protein HOP17_12230 [Acidobacteria bacterium]|nr:hypothetical protein [Acidobacteriota bacterium]
MGNETEIRLILHRGLNGTNPSAFRIDEDGLSVFELPLDGYRYNLRFTAVLVNEKVYGSIARLVDEDLSIGEAVFTPQFGEGHWSIRFPNLSISDAKNLLSKYAKSVLK